MNEEEGRARHSTAGESHQPSIGTSTEPEFSAARALISEAGLPTDDLERVRDELLVARTGDGLVGAVGGQFIGDAGLLRSLAVAPELRGSGLGTRLCHNLFQRAAMAGVS